MKSQRVLKFICATGVLALVAGSTVFSTSCVMRSGGTWMVKSAPLPEDWPELSPVDEVVIRSYPQYRAAFVKDNNMRFTDDQRVQPMFMELFNHIKQNDIAMTAPVEMEYAGVSSTESDMVSMAFLYRTTDIGRVGSDGIVSVRDVPSQTFVSVGVRGDYEPQRFNRALEMLNDWLANHSGDWVAAGPPRYLGYNGPFTPTFMRYGEAQVPVAKAGDKEGETRNSPR